MDIIELTRKLGAAIQNEEAYKNFMAVRDKNDKNEELQKQIGEFNLLKMQLDEELAKSKRQVKFLFPFDKQGAVNTLYTDATVLNVDYTDDGVCVEAIVDGKNLGRYKDFVVEE